VLDAKPDVLVIMIARILPIASRGGSGPLIIDSDSITCRRRLWAWRPAEHAAMRGFIDHVLALLPFGA